MSDLPLKLSKSSNVSNDAEYLSFLSELEKESLDKVVNRLAKDQKITRKKAREIREDFLRYFALIKVSDKPLAPPYDVDQFWHTFILHTRDYAAFCDHHFGRFIHHEPMIDGVNEEGFKNMADLLWRNFDALACCNNTCQADQPKK